MEIKAGEYVRTKCGIAKIKDISIKDEVYDLDKDIMFTHEENWQNTCTKSQIIKHSKNIIDLIEVGDYVNGEHIDFISKDKYGNKRLLIRDDIYFFNKYKSTKSIVTKEQFANIEYRIEAEE